MICGYKDCQQEITDNQFTYKYFPGQKIHKPVHNYHLTTNRKEGDDAKKPTADQPEKIIPVKEEDMP